MGVYDVAVTSERTNALSGSVHTTHGDSAGIISTQSLLSVIKKKELTTCKGVLLRKKGRESCKLSGFDIETNRFSSPREMPVADGAIQSFLTRCFILPACTGPHLGNKARAPHLE